MDLFFSPYTLAAMALGYLLGSIPFGYLLTRAAGLGDVRNIGSGNIGATNVLRTGHKGLAALTLLLDALKGTAAVLIGHWIGAHGGVAILASLLAGLARLPRPRVSRLARSFAAARASPPTSACCSASIGAPPSPSAPSGCWSRR